MNIDISGALFSFRIPTISESKALTDRQIEEISLSSWVLVVAPQSWNPSSKLKKYELFVQREFEMYDGEDWAKHCVSFGWVGIVLELSPETKKLVVNVFSNDEYSFSKQVTLVEILKPPSQLSSNSSLKSKNQLNTIPIEWNSPAIRNLQYRKTNFTNAFYMIYFQQVFERIKIKILNSKVKRFFEMKLNILKGKSNWGLILLQ